MKGQFVNPLDRPNTTDLRLFQWQERLPLRGQEPESPNYPLGALGRFSDSAKVITDQVQAPAPVVAQSILATASLITQQHVDVEIDGREFPTSLFLVTVARSGERKTASDSIILAPVKIFEKQRIEDYKEGYNDWLADLLVLKTKKKGQVIDHRAVMEHEELKPRYPMMLTKEPSYEGLIRSLHEGLRCMGLFSDEAGRFIGGYAMSEEHILKTAAGLSEIWDGSEITRTRSGDKQIYTLYDCRLSMHLMLQPIVAYKILNNPLLLGQGFLPRCLVVQPQSRIGTRRYIEANTKDDPAVRGMARTFNSLLRNPPKERQTVHLNPDAKAYWIDMHNEFEAKAAKEFEPIQAMTCKAAEQVARIAGVLAYMDEPNLKSIPLVAVERASALMAFYLKEALRIQQIAEEDKRINQAEKLLEWAFKDRSCTQQAEGGVIQIHMQGLLQMGPNQLRTKKRADSLLKFLHEHGLARKLPPTRFGETERKEAWEVRRFADVQELE